MQFPISDSAHTGDDAQASLGHVACDSAARCVVLYFQGAQLLARRFNAQGPIDHDALPIATLNTAATPVIGIASRGNGEYLFIWHTFGPPLVAAVRFDAATGKLIDDHPLDLTALNVFDYQSAAGVADGYLLLYENYVTSKLSLLRLVDGAAKETPGIPLPAGVGATAVFGSGTQAAVVGQGSFARFDFTQGAFLDTSPIAYDKYANAVDTPGVAFDGANYMLIWRSAGKVYAARIRASDGALLDLPDTFNEVTGGHLIATGTASSPTAWFDGTNIVALWAVGSSVVGARITTSGTRVSGTDSSAYEFLVRDTTQTAGFNAASGGGLGMVVWSVPTSVGVQAALLQAAAGTAPAVTPQAVSFDGTSHDAAGVASNGSDFLIGYRALYEHKIYARAVSGLTGAPLGPQQVVSALTEYEMDGSDRVALAWSGKYYFIAWRQQLSSYLKLANCDGTVLPGDPVLLGPGVNARIACNDDRCAVAWVSDSTVNVRRFDAMTGAAIDASPLTFTVGFTADFAAGPTIATDLATEPDKRTFLIVWATTTGVSARRLRSQGALLSETAIATTSYPYNPQVTSDGTQFAVSWVGTGLTTRLVDATSGLPTGSGTTAIGPVSDFPYQYEDTLSFDGASFLATYLDPVAYTLRGARLDKANALLDTSGFEISNDYQAKFAAGATSWGRSLVAFYEGDPASLSRLVVGRFQDNPLGVGTSGHTFVCPSGGSGGGSTSAGGGTGGDATGGDGASTAGQGGGTQPTAGGGSGAAGAPAAGSTADGQAGSAGTESGGTSSASGGGATTDGAGASTAGASDTSSAGATSAGGKGSIAGDDTPPANAGSAPNDSSQDSSGCGCRLEQRSSTSNGSLWLTAGALLVAARRRHTKRKSPER